MFEERIIILKNIKRKITDYSESLIENLCFEITNPAYLKEKHIN